MRASWPRGARASTPSSASLPRCTLYRNEKPELTPRVRLAFPAYSCEFSGNETLDEAITRYRTLGLTDLRRGPSPFLKTRYANTRTRGRSTDPGRGLADSDRLLDELRAIEGGAGSFVEFENRHGDVWRVEWRGAYHIAEWNTEDGRPQEIGLADLLDFAVARLRA
ncbi:hypothetical protein [Streptomyces althioticus]|uniref:hypothetical protein n=1 Tax=Streptomyces althioticus TaxID=83380 RepID=UPI003873C132|nr:hypothetical protein OG872_13365 [Streptomyces althioticus]